MKFSKLLQTKRKENNLTLRKVSEEIGLSISYLSDIEHGRRLPPKIKYLTQLEKMLNVKDKSLIRTAAQEREESSYLYWKNRYDNLKEEFEQILKNKNEKIRRLENDNDYLDNQNYELTLSNKELTTKLEKIKQDIWSL